MLCQVASVNIIAIKYLLHGTEHSLGGHLWLNEWNLCLKGVGQLQLSGLLELLLERAILIGCGRQASLGWLK